MKARMYLLWAGVMLAAAGCGKAPQPAANDKTPGGAILAFKAALPKDAGKAWKLLSRKQRKAFPLERYRMANGNPMAASMLKAMTFEIEKTAEEGEGAVVTVAATGPDPLVVIQTVNQKMFDFFSNNITQPPLIQQRFLQQELPEVYLKTVKDKGTPRDTMRGEVQMVKEQGKWRIDERDIMEEILTGKKEGIEEEMKSHQERMDEMLRKAMQKMAPEGMKNGGAVREPAPGGPPPEVSGSP